MISSIEVQNFKCFQTSKSFEFSKINLLTGINGRGKSSLLQSILLVAQSVDQTNETKKIILNGKYVSLGNYQDIKNSETPRGEDIVFSFKMEVSVDAVFHVNENEDDELSALVTSKSISLPKIEGLQPIQKAFNTFDKSLTKQLGKRDEIGVNMIDLPHMVFNFLISRIHYISADRIGPVKYVDKAAYQYDNSFYVGSRGEYTINVLANSNLPLANEFLYRGKDSRSVIQQAEEWMSYILEGAKIDIKGQESSSSVLWMLINNRSNSNKYKPANVGFGYSYVLPLIVSGLVAKKDDLIIVENPEAHLHPRAQSRIAEFFVMVAACGVQVIMESHSEHILNGLRVNALRPEIPINNKDLTIHYFDESFISSVLKIDEKGKIKNWPQGFFDQQEIDLANIFKLSR